MLAQGMIAANSELDPHSENFADRFSAALLERNILNEIGLVRARRAQSLSFERFDIVLSRLGLLNETQVIDALADFLGLAVVTPLDFPDAPVLAGKLPTAFLKTNRLLPIGESAGKVVLATADPFNTEASNAISFLLNKPVERKLAAPADIEKAISRLYTNHPQVSPSDTDKTPKLAAAQFDGDTESDVRRLQDMASEAPIIKTVQDLIVRAVDAHASDIHIEPDEFNLRIRFRIDGVLHSVETLPLNLRLPLSSRIKVMAQLNIAERRLPQDGRTKATVRGREIDLRVSTMPTLFGESVVLRILDRSSVALDFDALGLSGKVLRIFLRDLAEPNGLILVTGPTGSGKTTTLYTALAMLNDAQRKLFTVEDPIEYQLPGINQIQVNSRIGLTFAAALRSMLRQDPDVIMVGEIRDLETAEMAIRASLTGHLVLSTVHTNSAVATVTRLLNMGVEDYLLASSLKCALAQRLVRCLCPQCAVPDQKSAELVKTLKQAGQQPAGKLDVDTTLVRRAAGCRSCRNTGFSGRTAIYELLPLSGPLRNAITQRWSEQALEAAARDEGMTSMLHNGLEKVLSGVTTLEEVLRVTKAADGTL